MDDFIYFLFLIAWLAFSFYQQSAKKKKRKAQMEAARQREQQRQEDLPQEERPVESQPIEETPGRTQPQPDFRKTLEEILLGEEFKTEEASKPLEKNMPKQQEPHMAKVSDEADKNVFQKYYDEEMLEGSQEKLDEEPEKLEDKIEELEEEMVLQEGETAEETSEKAFFDLRKAVIYSEIINRRYS